MRRRILKYTMAKLTELVPGPVIAVAWQHHRLTVWCEVGPPGQATQPHELVAVATGEAPPGPGWHHAGSAVSDEVVFHVYQRAR